MAGDHHGPTVLDTTVLSNFASTDGISLLTTVVESPAVVATVRTELQEGVDAGHDYLDTAVAALDDGLPVRDGATETVAARDRLDPGEADSLRLAADTGGTLATDDLAARRLADQRGVPVTGSIGLLIIGIENGHLDAETADEWLTTWRQRRGYYAPVESVAELLDGD